MLREKNLKFRSFFLRFGLTGSFIFSIFTIPIIKDLIPNFTAIVEFVFRILLQCFLHVPPWECCQLLTVMDSGSVKYSSESHKKNVLWTILFRIFYS